MSQNNASFTVKIPFLPIVEEFKSEFLELIFYYERKRFSELKANFETSMNDIVQSVSKCMLK